MAVFIDGALCSQIPDADSIFFLDKGGSPKAAYRLCLQLCPDLEECRQKTILDDLAHKKRNDGELFGIQAGMTASVREAIASQLRHDEAIGQADRVVDGASDDSQVASAHADSLPEGRSRPR